MVFKFGDKAFDVLVKDMEGMDPSILKGDQSSVKKAKVFFFFLMPLQWRHVINSHPNVSFPQINIGLLLSNSQMIFEKAESSSMTLIGEPWITFQNRKKP